MYQRKTTQNKNFAIRKLVSLKHREGRSVVKHLNDFQDLVNQLVAMKLLLDDELQALLLLSSLPESWKTLVVSLSNSAPDGALTLSQVKDSMFNEEIRRKDMRSSSSQALSWRTEAEVRAGGDPINPKTNHNLNLEELSSVFTRRRRSRQKKLKILEE